MRFDAEPEPITEDDDAIRAALDGADVIPLLAAVAQLTGEHDLLIDGLRPDQTRLLEPEAGTDPRADGRGPGPRRRRAGPLPGPRATRPPRRPPATSCGV